MDKRPDIWFHLRDHETLPPPELHQRVREALFDNGALERLQQEEASPPDFLRTSITDIISKSLPDRSGITWKGQLFRRRLIYGSIAASVLLLLTGIGIYKTLISSARSPKDNIVVKSVPITSAQTADSLKSTDSGLTAAAVSPEDLATVADSATSAAAVKHDRVWSLHLDGHSLRLVDNDPLFTFTSYYYPEIGNYLGQKAGEEIKITVDQYTNIVISQQAAIMIREMYKTRSNGKPTRKARKMKERLEYWKKADEKRFDGALRLNPADPVDLAEFIFR